MWFSEQGKTVVQAAAAGSSQAEDYRFLSTFNSTHSPVECHGFHTSIYDSLIIGYISKGERHKHPGSRQMTAAF